MSIELAEQSLKAAYQEPDYALASLHAQLATAEYLKELLATIQDVVRPGTPYRSGGIRTIEQF